MTILNSQQALNRLKEGNQCFRLGKTKLDFSGFPERRRNLVLGQKPFAAILACSDSRVPVELIFDQGIGNLFVIRVAGNIVEASQLGSIEYAVSQLNVPLVLVLGHAECGAVATALQKIQQPGQKLSPAMQTIIDHITPTLKNLVLDERKIKSKEILIQAVQANLKNSVKVLRENSPILKQRIMEKRVRLIGAEYSTETGVVRFFE